MGAHRKIALLSGATLLLLGQTALAASDSPADKRETVATEPVRLAQNETAAPIETVIVTAEKRSADVQKVPIAVSAIDGNSLESQSIIGFKELGSRVPSLRFGSGVTGGENVITIRGLGSVNTTPGGDSPVAYSVDGVGCNVPPPSIRNFTTSSAWKCCVGRKARSMGAIPSAARSTW